jgi:type II secretory pathway component PulK
MRRKTNEILTDQRGAALIFVILALVIVSILAMAIASLVHSNLAQTVSEEDTLKALQLSGFIGQDQTYAARWQEDVGRAHHGGHVFSEAATPTCPTPRPQITLNGDDGFEGGSVNVTVRALEKDSERWVEITSAAALDDSSVTKTITLQFLAENPLIQMKS